MRVLARTALALSAGAGMFAATAGMSVAGTPTGDYAPFAQCPTSVPNLASCVYSDTTSGSIDLPSQSVPITNPVVLQGGYTQDPTTGDTTFYGAANGATLSASPQNVPGGLLGIMPPNLFPQPLQGILDAAINAVNGVTATAELVGPAQFSFDNFLNQDGPTVTLPVRIQLKNPFLGSACYIGSASDPITLNVTDGTTTPPTGVTPLNGSFGTLNFDDNGNLIAADGVSLVDNTFAVPSASGCGGIFSGLIDPILGLKTGIPASAGKSSAVLNGNSEIAAASAVVASEG